MSSMKPTLAPVAEHEKPDSAPRSRSSLQGFYLLCPQAGLSRLDSEARPSPDAGLDGALRNHASALLEDYRRGSLERVNLGIIAGPSVRRHCDNATMIFSDWLLNELFDTGRVPGMPLTLYERRSKFKSVFQGMEILLNKARASDAPCPNYCPVLVEPQSNLVELCERYGVELMEDVPLFEVLDLSAPGGTPVAVTDGLMRMVACMRSAQMSPPEGVPENFPEADDTASACAGVSLPAAILDMGERSPCSLPLASAPATCFRDGDPVSGWLLEWFTPFNELTDTQRNIIAGYETIRKAAAGTTLIERGSTDASCIYLIEGTLALAGADGAAMRVSGGTRRSRLPISLLSPHVFDVTAVTDVSVVMFHTKLIEKINEITRTYTSIESRGWPGDSTADISNGAQAVYLRHERVNFGEDGS